jgi:hypothetical protein
MGPIRGEAQTGEAPTGADSVQENEVEIGSVVESLLTGIANGLSEEAQTGEDQIEESSSGGPSASGADEMMAGVANALSGGSPTEESSPEDETVGGSPLGGNESSGADDMMAGIAAALQRR